LVKIPLQNKDLLEHPAKRDKFAIHPEGDVISVQMCRHDQIATLHALTIREIGSGVATCETMQLVWRHNPESLWTIHRRTPPDGPDTLAGYFGFLHLNEAGLEALHARTLNGRAPDLALLAKAGERPAAIYAWAGIARQVRVIAQRLVAHALGAKRYGGLAVYATAGTPGGLKWLNQLGHADRGPQDNTLGSIFRIDTVRPVTARTRHKDA
jgi:hypothetical protein